MKINRVLLFIALPGLCLIAAISSLYLFGYTNNNVVTVTISRPPDAAETLTFNPHADILQWDDAIYQTDIDWVDVISLVAHEQLGEITFEASRAEDFKNGAANTLPLGAKIYSVHDRQDILIVTYHNVMKRYLRNSEG